RASTTPSPTWTSWWERRTCPSPAAPMTAGRCPSLSTAILPSDTDLAPLFESIQNSAPQRVLPVGALWRLLRGVPLALDGGGQILPGHLLPGDHAPESGDLQPEIGAVPEYPGGVEVHRPAAAALIIGGDRVAVVHPAVGRDLRDQVIVDLDIPALGAVGGGPVQDAQGDEQHRHHQHCGSEGQRKAPSLLAFHRCTASLCYIDRYEYTSPGEAVPSIYLTKQAGSLHCCHIRSQHWRQAKKAPAVRRGPERSSGQDYSLMSMTTPEPTVRPPSRIAKRRPFSMAMG